MNPSTAVGKKTKIECLVLLRLIKISKTSALAEAIKTLLTGETEAIKSITKLRLVNIPDSEIRRVFIIVSRHLQKNKIDNFFL